MRLPSLKRLPDFGVHATGGVPSRSSFAVTLKATGADFAPFLARTVLLPAPASVGCVTSKSSPGTVRVPLHVSRPKEP